MGEHGRVTAKTGVREDRLDIDLRLGQGGALPCGISTSILPISLLSNFIWKFTFFVVVSFLFPRQL